MPRNRPLLVALTSIVVAVAIVGGAAFAADEFSDVPDAHPFHDDIAWLADSGVTTGFDDGTYRPGQPVTRGSMAAFMRRLAGGDPAVDPVVDAATTQGRTAQQLGTTVRFNQSTATAVVPDNSTTVTVTTLTLPAGTWVIDLFVAVGSSEAGNNVICGLPGSDSPFTQANIGTAAGYSSNMLLSGKGTLVVPTTTTFTFTCYKNGASTLGSTNVNLARVVATKVDTLVNPSP